MLEQIALGLILSTGIGGLAYWRGSLTRSGWAGAILTGTLTFGFGGWSWGLTLITFFLSSSFLSHYKEQIKEARAAEKFAKGGKRDFAQALANGGVGAVLALLYGLLQQPPLLMAAFLGVMATVTADTWATELGVLSPDQPRLITTGKPVEAGTSGGITVHGSVASAAGGLLIGLAMLYFTFLTHKALLWWFIPAGLLGGFFGSMSDSLMGATKQAIFCYPNGKETEKVVGKDGTPNTFVRGWRWLNNDLVNLLSSLIGGGVAILIFLLFH